MREDVKWPLAAAFLCAALLGLVALLAYGSETIRHLDARIFVRLSVGSDSSAHAWAHGVVTLADPKVPLLGLVIAACGVALLRGRALLALAAILAVAGANLTTQALKHVLAHHKAQEILGGPAHLDAFAFPSGHATAAASVAIAFAFVVPRSLLPLTLLLGAAFALAVGCSLILLSDHYPSDVLAGYLVAAGWGFAVLAGVRAAEPAAPEDPSLSSSDPLPSR